MNGAETQDDLRPGRACPLHYRYAPASLAGAPALHCDTLYVAGGVYGNRPALRRINELFEREPGPKRLVFNGDFNWFDIDDAAFVEVNRTVLGFDATRGNVETELPADTDPDTAAGADADAGCGCAYPAWVGDAVVAHSNTIMGRLRATAGRHAALARAVAALPMQLRVEVGGLRIGVVHGDAQSLSGWGFAQESLAEPAHAAAVARWFGAAQVDVFASSHTCLPVFQRVDIDTTAAGLVLNNGAAGMPNFAGSAEGLLTRIATRPLRGPQARFGLRHGAVFIDAIGIDFDAALWQAEFLAQWPAGSAAHTAYWQRICDGPDYALAQALRF